MAQLAQANVARLRAGLDDPVMRGFVTALDGVNALAAPGGYVHITRGALSLMSNEAELAGVLGHEIIHVTEKHTIRAIQKGKAIQMGANETMANNPAIFNKIAWDNVHTLLKIPRQAAP